MSLRYPSQLPTEEWEQHGGMRAAGAAFDIQGRPTQKLVTVRCPFCNAIVTAHLWSLCGGGKKCSCGAVIGSIGARRKVKPA